MTTTATLTPKQRAKRNAAAYCHNDRLFNYELPKSLQYAILKHGAESVIDDCTPAQLDLLCEVFSLMLPYE